jgi:hypothetical protein
MALGLMRTSVVSEPGSEREIERVTGDLRPRQPGKYPITV